MAVREMTLNAARLKQLRALAGLTQQELATRAEVSIALILGLEQGKQDNPRLTTLRKLAAALGCTVGRLVDEPPSAVAPPKRRTPKK
jgi:transcriptional regulator with XRE-family HTH domain